MSLIWQELKVSLRLLTRAPLWVTTVVLTLVLAIGLSCAVYAVFQTVLLRSLPYPDGDELVLLQDQYLGQGYSRLGVAEPEFYDYSERSRELSSLAPMSFNEADLRVEGEPRRLDVALVTSDLFETLGVEPVVGRAFRKQETQPGGNSAVVILSRPFFQTYFGGDESRIGEAILELDGLAHLVVGVMPEGFLLPTDLGKGVPTDLLLPLVLDPANPGDRGNPNLTVVARLRDGATLESAETERDEIVASMRREHPHDYEEELGFNLLVEPLLDTVVGDMDETLVLVFSAVCLVFLVALSNVVSLTIVRLGARRAEIGMRLALGARVSQLLRQLGIEAALLAVCGGGLGLWLGHLAFRRFAATSAGFVPRLRDAALHPSVVMLATGLIGVSFLTMILVALVRGPRSKKLQQLLRSETGGTTMPAQRSVFRSLLVAAQVALSLALLAGTGLLLQSYHNTNQVELGFSSDHVLITDLTLPAAGYARGPRAAGFYEELLLRVRGLPGVVSAGVVGKVPMDSKPEVWPVEMEGGGHRSPDQPPPEAQIVSAGYLDALQIPVVDGEGFASVTDAESSRRVLVSETTARQFWPDTSPVGHRLKVRMTPDSPWLTIAGVVQDVRHHGLNQEPSPQIYFHHSQIPELVGGVAFRWMHLAVRTDEPGHTLHEPLRQEVRALDPEIPRISISTLDDVVARETASLRFILRLLSAFAILALTLTLLGLYGLISEFAGGRRREMAIRQAIGAQRRSILGLVLGQGMRWVAVGVAVGSVASFGFSKLISHHLYGISGLDLPTLALAAVLISLCAAMACLVPAWRASILAIAAEIRQP